MTKRLPAESTPGPLEGYAARFDDLFRARAQRESFRRYLEGLPLSVERNKILTALATTEPVAGAQRREAQRVCNGSFWSQGATRERPTSAISNSCSTILPPPRTRRACWSSTSTGIASGASAPPTSAGSG